MVSFGGWVISYASEWEDYFSWSGGFLGIRPALTFLAFAMHPGTVMVPVGVSFSSDVLQ